MLLASRLKRKMERIMNLFLTIWFIGGIVAYVKLVNYKKRLRHEKLSVKIGTFLYSCIFSWIFVFYPPWEKKDID